MSLLRVPASVFPVHFLLVVEEEPPDNKINNLLIVLGKKNTTTRTCIIMAKFQTYGSHFLLAYYRCQRQSSLYAFYW